MCRFPIQTNMPGLKTTLKNVEFENGLIKSADYEKRSGGIIHLTTETTRSTMMVMSKDYSSIVNFCPWPGDKSSGAALQYPKYWSAFGFSVSDSREGIGTALYAVARIYLGILGLKIAPSDNLMVDGKAFWEKMDPSIQWEGPSPNKGEYRPLLAGHIPPTS